jgi:branched-chain amino acid transport system permease protein
VTSIGGGCFALAATTIGPDTFGLQRSIEFIAGLVIGGVATILGPAIGGILVEWLPYWAFEIDWPIIGSLQGPQAGILYGLLLILIVFFMPGGIVYGLRFLRAKFLVIVPRLPVSRTATPVVAEPDESELTPSSPSGAPAVLASTPVQQPQGEHS